MENQKGRQIAWSERYDGKAHGKIAWGKRKWWESTWKERYHEVKQDGKAKGKTDSMK